MDKNVEKLLKQYHTGQYLKSIREKLKQSRREVSSSIGVTLPYLFDIEKGIKMPSDDLIAKIAQYYNIDEDDLFERYGKISPYIREKIEDMLGLHHLIISIKRKNYTPEQEGKVYEDLDELFEEFLRKHVKK